MYIVSAILLICIVVLAVSYEKEEIKEEKIEEEKINFESKSTIQLLRTKTGQIEAIDLNYYLLCVVASEMPFKYEYEALKAQVVVARTYLFNKMRKNAEENADACDNYAHCQAFNDLDTLKEIWRKKGFTDNEILEGENKIKRAIVESSGEVIAYNNELIDAVFHASSPVKTENASAIWSQKDISYLKSVENVEDETYERRNTINEISYATFKNTLIDKGYIFDLSKEEFMNIKINEYTESGRVKNVSVGSHIIKAEDLRTLFNINSTNFTITNYEDKIEFNVLGFGHGVGLSQVGANEYARQGKDYKDIIHHYYTGVDIVNIDD